MQAIKNTIELNIYDDDLEIKNTFRSYGLKWKAFKRILAKQKEIEELKAENEEDALPLIFEIVRMVFPQITEEDLGDAYIDDIFYCFNQAVEIADGMAKNL